MFLLWYSCPGAIDVTTQGPRFASFTVDDAGIRITCDPVAEVRWRTFAKVGHVDYAPQDGGLSESRLPDGFTPRGYVRIELVGHDRKRAWSNPFFVQPTSNNR